MGPLPFKVQVALMTCLAISPLCAEAKPALCVIKNNGATAFSGRCQFLPEGHGSFTLRHEKGGQLLKGISAVSVSITQPGMAEVRGLTVRGINSRWGPAVRSSQDPACWQGRDFEICAY